MPGKSTAPNARCRYTRSKIVWNSVLPQPSAIVYSYIFAYGGCPSARQRNASDSVSDARTSQLAPVANGARNAGGSDFDAMVTLVPAVVSAARYETRGHSGVRT